MTDEKLGELETACSVDADKDGRVRLLAADVLALVCELRDMRSHAEGQGAPVEVIATMRRLLADLSHNWERRPSVAQNVGSRIPVQDPGR